jgi:hypothetical protein
VSNPFRYTALNLRFAGIALEARMIATQNETETQPGQAKVERRWYRIGRWKWLVFAVLFDVPGDERGDGPKEAGGVSMRYGSHGCDQACTVRQDGAVCPSLCATEAGKCPLYIH